jgi:hypothetical protein
MIVTSVIIPVAVPLVLYLVFKILFGQQPVVVPQPTELPSASIRPIYTYKTKDDYARTKGEYPFRSTNQRGVPLSVHGMRLSSRKQKNVRPSKT